MEKMYRTSQRKIVFSGEKIKEFLQRNGLSYKATAEKPGIDKDSASEEMFEYKNSKNNDFSMEDIQSLIEHNNRIPELLGKKETE